MWIALLLVSAAGLSTIVGSLLGLFVRKPGNQFMSFTLGFSAGILILTAFVELLAKAIEREGVGFFWAHVAFFMGMAGYLLIDFLLPHGDAPFPHRIRKSSKMSPEFSQP